MFRGLFPKLGELFSPDRFAGWPAADPATPIDIDLAGRRVGPLCFGAPFADAAAFGRPDHCGKLHPAGLSLLHARRGLILEFYPPQGFGYAAFLVAPDPGDPEHPELAHVEVRFADGAVFDARSTEADLRRRFGVPRGEDRDEDETILTFVDRGLLIECELRPGPGGTLKRLNLFPE